MRVSYLLALLPVATTLAAVTPATISTDITKIASAVNKFYTDLQSCLGGGGALSASCELKLQNDEQAIETALNQTNKDCTALPKPATAAQSKKIYNQLVSLEASNEQALNYIVAHKAQFAAAGLTGLVCQDLSALASEVASGGQCLVAKSAKSYQAKGKALEAKYASDFSSAESSFGC